MKTIKELESSGFKDNFPFSVFDVFQYHGGLEIFGDTYTNGFEIK